MNQNTRDLWINYAYVQSFTALKQRRPSRIFDDSGPSITEAENTHIT
jgi:hypothetical protein